MTKHTMSRVKKTTSRSRARGGDGPADAVLGGRTGGSQNGDGTVHGKARLFPGPWGKWSA